MQERFRLIYQDDLLSPGDQLNHQTQQAFYAVSLNVQVRHFGKVVQILRIRYSILVPELRSLSDAERNLQARISINGNVKTKSAFRNCAKMLL